MHNGVICTRMKSLHEFQPSLWFCASKTVPLGPELHVSMGPSRPLWVCAFKRATLGPELHVSMGPRHHLWLCACKTGCLVSDVLVSMGSSPHLSFLDDKLRILDQNNKSLWVPALICGFCMQNIDFWTRVQVSMGTRHHLWFCAYKTAWFAPEWQVYVGCCPHLRFCACKTATLGPDLQVCIGPRPHLGFSAQITACLAQ